MLVQQLCQCLERNWLNNEPDYFMNEVFEVRLHCSTIWHIVILVYVKVMKIITSENWAYSSNRMFILTCYSCSVGRLSKWDKLTLFYTVVLNLKHTQSGIRVRAIANCNTPIQAIILPITPHIMCYMVHISNMSHYPIYTTRHIKLILLYKNRP